MPQGEGVPKVQIIEDELDCLGDRKGHDGHLVKKLMKKNLARVILILSRLPCRDLPVVTRLRQQLAISAFISKRSFQIFNLSSTRVFKLKKP